MAVHSQALPGEAPPSAASASSSRAGSRRAIVSMRLRGEYSCNGISFGCSWAHRGSKHRNTLCCWPITEVTEVTEVTVASAWQRAAAA